MENGEAERTTVTFRCSRDDVQRARSRAALQGTDVSHILRVLLGVYAHGGFPFTDAMAPRLIIDQQSRIAETWGTARSLFEQMGGTITPPPYSPADELTRLGQEIGGPDMRVCLTHERVNVCRVDELRDGRIHVWSSRPEDCERISAIAAGRNREYLDSDPWEGKDDDDKIT